MADRDVLGARKHSCGLANASSEGEVFNNPQLVEMCLVAPRVSDQLRGRDFSFQHRSKPAHDATLPAEPELDGQQAVPDTVGTKPYSVIPFYSVSAFAVSDAMRLSNAVSNEATPSSSSC